MKLILIAALARNGVIGKGNDLLWHEPLDKKHFRDATRGCPVIMGRKTWDSLPSRFRPLPERRNIVLTRSPQAQFVGATAAGNLAQALALVEHEARVFVIGGAQIYAQALPLAHDLDLTELDADLDGDVFFPPWSRSDWALVSSHAHLDAQGRHFAFNRYSRKA